MQVLSNQVETLFESLYNQKILDKYPFTLFKKEQENHGNKRNVSYDILPNLNVKIYYYNNFDQNLGTVNICSGDRCMFVYSINKQSYKDEIKTVLDKVELNLDLM